MNTNTDSVPSPDTRPDYEIARDELHKLFASLGLWGEITGVHAAIGELGMSKGWAHVGMIVTFTRPERRTSESKDYRAAVSQSFEWKVGTGCADWAKVLKRTHVGSDDYPLIKAMMGHGSLSPTSQVRLASKYLNAFVAKVDAAEVLARCCEDGRSAESRTFEDWASEFGFDTYSRKAEKTYFACQEAGTKARKLVDRETFDKLADLACQL